MKGVSAVSKASLQAGNVWRDIIAGRLRVQRFYERAGRRFVVLSPGGKDDALTPRQRQIVGFRAYGETTKRVAQELGVSEPTVIREIGAALEKLGLKSEMELPLLFGTALRSGRRA